MAITPFQEWLEAQIKAHKPPSANALALSWGVPSSYIARWRKGAMPEFRSIGWLAEKSGTSVAKLQMIFFRSEEIRSRERLQTGTDRRSSRRPLAKIHPRLLRQSASPIALTV